MKRKILILLVLSTLVTLAVSTVSNVSYATLPGGVGHPPKGPGGSE